MNSNMKRDFVTINKEQIYRCWLRSKQQLEKSRHFVTFTAALFHLKICLVASGRRLHTYALE